MHYDSVCKGTTYFSRLTPYRYDGFPHIVADSAIGGFKFLSELAKEGYKATFSMSVVEKPWMWDLLARNCTNKQWKAVVDEEGIIASLWMGTDENNNRCRHKLTTNAFAVTQPIIDDNGDDNGNICSDADSSTIDPLLFGTLTGLDDPDVGDFCLCRTVPL
jgi:hypothetical protein